MPDAYRNIPLEQRISSLREGEVTNYGTPIRSRQLTVQPRKKTDMHYCWQEGSATGVDPDAPKVWAPMYSHASQDIATRLRIIHCAADDLTPCGTCLTCQAADEIERLQAENTRLASFLHPIGATIRYDGIKDMTSEQVDQILKAIKETHRG